MDNETAQAIAREAVTAIRKTDAQVSTFADLIRRYSSKQLSQAHKQVLTEILESAGWFRAENYVGGY